MTVSFYEIFLATVVCSIFTVVIYITSWLTYEENDEEKFNECNSSNMQGLENDKPIPHGEPKEILNFESETHLLSPNQHPSGIIVNEKSDILCLQDEVLRSQIAKNQAGVSDASDDHENVTTETNTVDQCDPVVHADARAARLRLLIRYDGERSKLIVQVLDGQGLIPPELDYAPEMCLKFTLVGPHVNETTVEKHTRIFVANDAVIWKEPMTFCVTFENAIKQNLYIFTANRSDPAASYDHDISIPLSTLASQDSEIKEWFTLEVVESSY
ncbi:unnamed protein product [Rotaria socialis]|uniref:C2 domain-containing protein n=2 Tax=Rotaria socialis TaxID=392032 RepID=A0A817MSR1_9BILA|nr:unnamed protein product [Rotaria socialis]CAF3459205.1 unnamed protein product [Rotaria socialis]CAF3716868.1 unnamed protein product [Rotaria socialis]CAF3778539.1 unnamed protein product [Rotaria socialis]